MPTTESVLVIANAAAGSAQDDAITTALTTLREYADVEVVVPEDPEDLHDALARAAGRDLVVLGGDGSVHRLISALAADDLLDEVGAVGVVPLGTGNDLARALGLPENPAEAARVALEGEVRAVDLLRDDVDEVVVNAVHAGVAAEATAQAAEVKGLLGTIGYAVGAVRAGSTAAGWKLRVTVDDDVVLDGSEPTLMVTVAVGPSIGGGTPIAPGATHGDRVATVIVATATGPLARAAYALDLRTGDHEDREDVSVFRGREVVVEAVGPADAFPVTTDGEVSDITHLRRTWRLEPAAWRARVPRSPE